ncbi:MAG: OmpW family outer membrane protein, partial [Chlamydiota bacterium]
AGRYSLETNIQAWKDLYAFGEIGFLYTTGSSVGLGNHTRLYSIPINLGLKYFFHFDRLHPYLGLGLTVAYSNIQNDSADVTRSPSGWGVGGIGKVGFLAYLTNSVFFDFFADYTYLKTSLSRDKTKRVETRKANLSGLAIGAGIGFRF